MAKNSTSTPTHIAAFWMETARLLERRVFHTCGDQSVNPLQLYALYLIAEHERMTMKQLATHLSITSPSASALVQRLVKLNWVKRNIDPSNRREIRLSLAAEGKKIMLSQMQKREKAMKEIIGLLSKEDQKLFEHLLHSLHHALLPQKSS